MTRHPVRIPPMLATTLSMGLSSLDGMLFKEGVPCPHCGGRPMPYDTKIKHYATLITPEGDKPVYVKVRRFTCRECGTLIYADEPFYPDTRLGSAVVDLALALTRVHSFSHTADIMEGLGIRITRGSVRNYALSDLPMAGINYLYGMPMPNSIVSLMGQGVAAGQLNPDLMLAACGSPARYVPHANKIQTAAEFHQQKRASRHHPVL